MTFKKILNRQNDIRIKKWFAIFPVVIYSYTGDDDRKCRTIKWLEYVEVKQEYCYFGCSCRWKNRKFI